MSSIKLALPLDFSFSVCHILIFFPCRHLTAFLPGISQRFFYLWSHYFAVEAGHDIYEVWGLPLKFLSSPVPWPCMHMATLLIATLLIILNSVLSPSPNKRTSKGIFPRVFEYRTQWIQDSVMPDIFFMGQLFYETELGEKCMGKHQLCTYSWISYIKLSAHASDYVISAIPLES